MYAFKKVLIEKNKALEISSYTAKCKFLNYTFSQLIWTMKCPVKVDFKNAST